MPLISQASIVRAADKAGKPCPNHTSWGDFTSNLTHLHLEGRGIRFITNLESCFAVRVLYLYSNRIQAINGLENLRQLTHLYLQKNQIQKIEGLENLGRLQKLYLEDNEISCVESLEGCTSLQELHLSRQSLPAGVELAFDPNCLEALEGCLGRLALQHCNIADVSPLAALHQLHNLNLAGNQIQEVARIQGMMGSLPQLQTLDVRDNPLCQARSYRKDIVGVAQRLQQLDGSPVLKQERLFLQRLHSRKLSRDVSFKSASDGNMQPARNMLEAMPNTTNSTCSNKTAGGGSAMSSRRTGSTSSSAHPAQSIDQFGSAANAERTASASSTESAPDHPEEAAFNLLQEIAPNMPADQHALNDLSELHSRAVSTMNGPGIMRMPSARGAPTRTSSWSSSRGVSALPRSESNLAVEADGNQLTLQGLSIV
ncbi:TPA: hypothetical protein ACH3X3_012075 [Trebouxia sp. C0006]